MEKANFSPQAATQTLKQGRLASYTGVLANILKTSLFVAACGENDAK